ncbi:hypothetical protein D5086_000972 [Populus alba]|uniref:Uncharacterized protein n=1 Tax=Populus alba TaxID=43335 RepID=A0ACC4CXF9_POPAL
MLAGCSSSTLLSPRHRLRSESPAQFQACHFQLPSMSTQRLDLPCSFSRKESSRSQPIRPVGVGLSVDKPLESKTSSCSLKQNTRLPPLATSNQSVKDEFWERGKSLKRFAEQSVDESCINRAKRKRGNNDNVKPDDFCEGGDSLSLGQLGSGNFWFQPSLEVPRGLNPQQFPFSLTCSGDEERVCFVPSEVISPPLPLSNNPWVGSVITEITDLGEKDGESSQRPVKEASGSSTSSESQSLGLRLSENVVEHEVGNGSRNPHPQEGAAMEAAETDQREFQGFELVSLLTACVEAITLKNIAGINHFLAELGGLASPKGIPISRLAAYYTEALALRVTRLWPHIFHITAPRELDRVDDDSGTALRLLNQSLASRTNPPSHVRITGIGESKQELNETGDRLAGFAEALNLPFEFHPVVDRLEDVRLWMLHVKERECVAINCVFQMHKTLYDGSGGALRDFLGLIRSTNPAIVIVAEQEAEHNAPNLETRVCNSLKYYSALFDSIDSSLPFDSPVRIKIEEMYAREIRNIVACEGSDRHERHEMFDNWKKLMDQGGLRCLVISEREMLQSQMLLKMYSCDSYRVKKHGQEGAALTLSWLDQPLYTIRFVSLIAQDPLHEYSSFIPISVLFRAGF